MEEFDEAAYRAEIREEKYIKVMFDYCSSGVWLKSGSNAEVEDFPLSVELQEKITRWVRNYDTAASYHMDLDIKYPDKDKMPDNVCVAMEKLKDACEHYFIKSVEIAIEIKKELPDWTVVIFNEYDNLGLPFSTDDYTSEITADYQLPDLLPILAERVYPTTSP